MQEELPVLEAFINISNRLKLLKKVRNHSTRERSRMLTTEQDTTKFIRAQDVMSIYNQIVKQSE